MKLYQIIKEPVNQNPFLIQLSDKTVISWVLNLPDSYKNKSETALKQSGICILEYKIKDIPLEQLMNIMYWELSSSDTKQICKEYKWISEYFHDYLKGKENTKPADNPEKKSPKKKFSFGLFSNNTLIVSNSASDSVLLDDNDYER